MATAAAAVSPFATVRSLKSDMAGGIHFPSSSSVAKAFTRPSMVNFIPYNNNNRSKNSVCLVRCSYDDDECPKGPNYPSSMMEDALRYREEDIRAQRKIHAEMRWATRQLYKIYMRKYKQWDEKQFLLVGASVYAAWHAVTTFALAIFIKDMFDPIIPLGYLQKLLPSDYKPMVASCRVSLLQFGRNFAIYRGVYALIAYIMKRSRGKEQEDFISSMVAGLGSGVIISLVTGLRGPMPIFLVGVINAPICALAFKLQGKPNSDNSQKLEKEGGGK